MREDESRIMQTRKIVKRDDSNQISDKIRYRWMKRDNSDTNISKTSATMNKLIATKNTTRRRFEGHDFQSDTKINLTSLFLASGLVQKNLTQERRVFTAAARAVKGQNVLGNASVMNRFSVEDRKNSSSAQMNFEVQHNLNQSKSVVAVSSVSRKHQIQGGSLRSSGLAWNRTSGRNGENPCVKQITKTYHSALKRTFTEFVCYRASFYCSPKLGGLGRCIPVKRFYPSINKVLTTACKCK